MRCLYERRRIRIARPVCRARVLRSVHAAVCLVCVPCMLCRPAQVAHRAAYALVAFARLGQACIGKIKRAAVVRLQHQQAQGHGFAGVQHVDEQEEVAQALRHLLFVDAQHAAVQPVFDEGLARGGFGLRLLVFVMGKNEVGPAAVYVDGQSQVFLAHGRAFQVPARPPGAPGTFPARFARLCRLPQCEVERVAFALIDVHTRAALQLVDIAAGELAVCGEAAHGEVDVAVCLVGVPRVDELFH